MADDPLVTKGALLSSLPLWVQAVSMVGFPILVAGFYMAKDIGLVPSLLAANAAILTQVHAQHDTQLVYLQESLRLQRAVCRNTAQTPEAMRTCNQGE